MTDPYRPLLAGVDAGGTKIRAGVGTAPSRILARVEAPAVRLRAEGPLKLAAAIAGAVEQALRPAGLSPPAEVLVVGAAGAGQPRTAGALERALEATRIAGRTRVVTDVELVLSDAFGTGPGVVLVAGTGSIAMGRLDDGTLVRAGGLGPELGDPGSGFALGAAAAAAAVEAGRDGEGLRQRLLAVLRLPDATALATWRAGATATAVAALAPHLLAAMQEGDPTAATIAARGARALAGFVAEVASRFPPQRPIALVLAGGLSENRCYRTQIELALAEAIPWATVRPDPPDAVRGALRLAEGMDSTRGSA